MATSRGGDYDFMCEETFLIHCVIIICIDAATMYLMRTTSGNRYELRVLIRFLSGTFPIRTSSLFLLLRLLLALLLYYLDCYLHFYCYS